LKRKFKLIFQWLFVIGWIGTFTFTAILVYWYYRPNTSYINPDLDMETWDAIADGSHNSNTDMILWNNQFYLIHASSPFHYGTSESKLIIWRSSDTKDWKKVGEIDFEGNDDIRDPKFANISGKLFVYALANRGLIANPYKTVYKVSDDGEKWSDWKELKGVEEGWLFWRPKTFDNNTWYVSAYWWEHGKSMLFKSTDGIEWEEVSKIYEGETNDETAIEFLPDGKLICTARLEGFSEYNIFGDSSASTLIAVSKSQDYDKWEYSKDDLTRLDGPCLFRYNDRVFAVGRYEPEAKGTFSNLGSFFCKKRTSLFLLEENRLIYLSDFPSAGDTSYSGVVINGDYVYISYYTSDINHDYTWIMGQYLPTNIRIAKIKLSKLEKVADNPPDIPEPTIFKIDALFLDLGLIVIGIAIVNAILRERRRKIK